MKHRRLLLPVLLALLLWAIPSVHAQASATGSLNVVKESPTGEGEVELFGPVDRQGFSMEPFVQWFQENYDDYDPDPAVLEKIGPLVKNCEIEVFMGTWCSDSRRQIPYLYHILDAVRFQERSLNVCAMARASAGPRRCPNDEDQGRNIIRVPTIIVSRDGEELGRIIEYPVDSLEEDLLAIVRGDEYQPNYALLSQINLYVLENGLDALRAKRDSLGAWYQWQGFSHEEIMDAMTQTVDKLEKE